MIRLFVFLALAATASAVLITSPPILAGLEFPAWAWPFQNIGFFDQSIFNSNYTFFIDRRGHACDTNVGGTSAGIFLPTPLNNQALPGYPNKALFLISGINRAPCGPNKVIDLWSSEFRVGMIINGDDGDFDVNVWNAPYTYKPGDMALSAIGGVGMSDSMGRVLHDGPWYAPSKGIPTIFFGQMLGGQNTTGIMQPFLTQTGVQRALATPGSPESFYIWFGVVGGIFIMAAAAFQLGRFILSAGAIRVELPQIVMTIVFFLGFFLWFGCTFNIVTPSAVNWGAKGFLFDLCWPIAWTAIIVLGFYFHEAATLSSTQQGAVFDTMKWPLIIVLSIVWVIYIVFSIIFAVSPSFMVEDLVPSITENRLWTSDLYNIIRGSFAVVMIVVNLGVLAFGVVSLAMALPSSSGNARNILLRIIILATVLFLASGGFGLAYWASSAGLNTDRYNYCPACSVSQEIMLQWYGLPVLHHIFVSGCLLATFRVSTQKEIELSKSATSSTSSASGSSAGSSSSSSSASSDPVIEL